MRVILEDVPADGMCMFHAIAKPLGIRGKELKRMLQDFLRKHSDYTISDVSIRQWVEWEFNISLERYIKNFDSSSWWGGALDMTILCHMLGTPIYVYDFSTGKLISDIHPRKNAHIIPFIALCFVNKSHYMHVRFATQKNAGGGV